MGSRRDAERAEGDGAEWARTSHPYLVILNLFQGRFASYPMDDAHLMAAVRYVENNPVSAGMVDQAGDWPWSSAQSHLRAERTRDAPLTDLAALQGVAPNWRAMLRHGLEAGGIGAGGEALAEAIEARLRTGRPLAADAWIERQEEALGRPLKPAKRGPKPKEVRDADN